MTKIKTGVVVNETRPLLKPDRIMESADGGLLWAFTLSSALSFARQDTPVDEDPLIDYVGLHGAGRVNLSGMGATSFAGGGFDFSSVTAKGNFAECPAAAVADIYNDNQSWLLCAWVRLPSEADYHDGTAFTPFCSFTTAANGWISQADLCTFGQRYSGGVKYLSSRRQTAIGAVDSIDIAVNAADYGKVAMIMAWRDVANAERGLLYRTTEGTRSTVVSGAGVDNAADFSAQAGQFGITDAFWFTDYAAHLDASNFRLYRGWLENLNTSGRNPLVTVPLHGVTLQEFEWRNHNGRFS